MAQQQQDDDYADLVQDPDNVQAGITDAYSAAAVNARDQFSQNNAVVAQGGNLIGQGFSKILGDPEIGDPKVVQARHIQGAMQQILQEANEDSPKDETPLDKQQRIATLVAARMAGISPQIALKANMQATALQEAKNQQALITAKTVEENQVTQDNAASLAVKKAGANYQVYGMVKDKFGMPTLQVQGDMIPLYDAKGNLRTADFATDVSKAMAAAKAAGIQSPVMDTVSNVANNKQQLATTRANAILEKQAAMNQAKHANEDEDIKKYAAASFMLDYRSIPSDQRMPALATMKKYGLTPADGMAAKAEVANMKAAAAAQGSREGNIAILQQSISHLGDNVLDTLPNVDRTRVQLMNKVTAAGKLQFGDGNEQKYGIAVNGLVQEYARLMSGGTGITSDAARDHANALISAADSPEKMKATVQQLAKETQAIMQGSDEAREKLANPGRYQHMLKIQKAFGITELPDMVDHNNQPIIGTGFSTQQPQTNSAGTTIKSSGPRGSGVAGTLISGSPGNGNLTYNVATGKFQ